MMNQSAMNYFSPNTGGREGMFNIGAQIGAMNSPVGGLNNTIRDVLSRARQWSDSQMAQEQAMNLKKAEFGMGVGLKDQYAKSAAEKMSELRGMSGVDPKTGITYYQGARYMADPMGTARQLISNASPDDARGTADWGSWGYAPTQDVMKENMDSRLAASLGGSSPIVNWNLGEQSAAPVGRIPKKSVAPAPSPADLAAIDEINSI